MKFYIPMVAKQTAKKIIIKLDNYHISANDVEKGVKRILHIPKYMRIAFAARLGYPVSALTKHTRVRRHVEVFTHHNRFGNNGLD